MTRTGQRTDPGGLSHWPRILFLTTAAVAFVVLVGVYVYESVHSLDMAVVSGTSLWVIYAVSPGVVLGLLAPRGEANPWRTTSIWASLLSYMVSIAALTLAWIGDAIWTAGGHAPLERLTASGTLPAEALGSLAAYVAGTGAGLMIIAVPVFLLFSVTTLVVYARTTHQEPGTLSGAHPPTNERVTRLGSDFAVGAAVVAILMAALGLLSAMAYPHDAWSDMRRVAIFSATLGLAVVLVDVGTGLHLVGGRAALVGSALLWIGAIVLTVAGVLDSFASASLSGTVGTYALPFAYGSLGIGVGTFLFPAGVLALLAAINLTHIHPIMASASAAAPSPHAYHEPEVAGAQADGRMRREEWHRTEEMAQIWREPPSP